MRRRELSQGELRLFIALPVPEGAAAELAQALDPLRGLDPEVRWVPPAALHLTVLFLGSTPESQLPHLRAAIDEVAAANATFAIRTGSGGGRVGEPGRGGIGVGWLNLEQGAEETAHLATTLSDRLQTGSAWPAKGHAAHLTVARRATRQLVYALRQAGRVASVGWIAEEVILFSSEPGQGAPRYEALHRGPLRAVECVAEAMETVPSV